MATCLEHLYRGALKHIFDSTEGYSKGLTRLHAQNLSEGLRPVFLCLSRDTILRCGFLIRSAFKGFVVPSPGALSRIHSLFYTSIRSSHSRQPKMSMGPYKLRPRPQYILLQPLTIVASTDSLYDNGPPSEDHRTMAHRTLQHKEFIRATHPRTHPLTRSHQSCITT